jgi:hypothetical protein
MPVVRLDTYKASAFLVWQLKLSGTTIHEDGGDIIHVGLPTGEEISIHLIESSIQGYEIKGTVAYNHANNVHTLFLLWCDMLLPPEGDVIEVQDWEWPLLALYGDRIWAYDVLGGEIFIFPVFYDRIGPYRQIRYGRTVSARHLMAGMVDATLPFIKGRWRVASFGERTQHAHHKTHYPGDGEVPITAKNDPLAVYYAILNIPRDAEPEDVKTAYRSMARRFHPDLNRDANATQHMQSINEAYRKIMDDFEDP